MTKQTIFEIGQMFNAASADETRYHLTSVRIEKRGSAVYLIAADGYIAAERLLS